MENQKNTKSYAWACLPLGNGKIQYDANPIDKGTGKNIYIGIDNSDGSLWTEEFKSLSGCKRWLMGGAA